MKIIIRAMPDGNGFLEYLNYLTPRLPTAEWCFDQKHDAMDTFLRSLDMAGDDACLNLEEDIILTRDFEAKAKAAIAQRPDEVIQFFSMRKADTTTGSRYDKRYLMAQCTYYPAGFAKALRAFYPAWMDRIKHPTGNDLMLADFLRKPYWIHVPSLVQHRVAVSRIDTRRSSKRQSPTFTDPWE